MTTADHDLTHPDIDTSAVYVHANGAKGRVEDWAKDPDDRVKVRIKDAWLFLDELTKEEGANAEAS